MADYRKLDRWADRLLDTGKRNNLISFRDAKGSTAEVLCPSPESVFGKCSVGRVFEVFDPKLPDEEIPEAAEEESILSENAGSGEAEEPLLTEQADADRAGEGRKEEPAEVPSESRGGAAPAGGRGMLSREEYRAAYAPRVRNERYLLLYARTPNPMAAVKAISKKAKEMQDETGINAAYLAFGFLKWREKESSPAFYEAPLLLVHVNLLTGALRDPVKIEVSDDDVVVNPTFRYLLEAEYGLRLPEYTDGETLAAYYEKTAQAVRGTGWEVIDACKLGIFSFLKLNMYEDLKRNADRILKNENVRALLGEYDGEASEKSQIEETPGETGSGVPNPLIDLHTVVDADSSQIEAIEMAKSGKSFVLQGPPGTGKSQTITNIIAECLHDGKKVLFVSEKQAALNVVYDKLKKAGLADFCLELHSHKANKRAVIEELNRTLETPKSSVSKSAAEEIRQKANAQAQLDGYAFALHKKRENIELSLYELFERYSEERKYPEAEFAVGDIAEKGQTYFLGAVRVLEQYAEYVPSIGENYRDNPWYGFSDDRISYEGRAKLKADLAQLSRELRALSEETARHRERFSAPAMNLAAAESWQEFLDFCGKSDAAAPALLSERTVNDVYPRLLRLKDLAGKLVPLRDGILERFESSAIREIDGKTLYTRLIGEFESFFARMFSGDYRNLIAGIRVHAKNGEKPSYERAVAFAEDLMRLQEVQTAFEASAAPVQELLGGCWHGPDTDWDHVLLEIQKLQKCLRSLSENQQTSSLPPQKVGGLSGNGEGSPAAAFAEGNPEYGYRLKPFGTLPEMSREEFLAAQPDFRSMADALRSKIYVTLDPLSRLRRQFSADILDFEKEEFDICARKMEGCLADFGKLGNWLGFMAVLENLEKLGLTAFVDTIIKEEIRPEEMVGAYRRIFYKHWIEYLLFSVPELAGFTRIRQEQAAVTFARKDAMQYEISKLQIRAELSRKRPNLEMVAGGSAVAVLRREGSKKRKQMPIRRLLSETGSLVQILKPCFLMSPLSVSTFLDPDKIGFDTVVFDEASQIFPQDAVGAAYRGRQLIVVGDSRQMPPSDFFQSFAEIEAEDEETGDVGDFESILDVCSAVLTTKQLAWHYRSHYEQLIAFSNRHFYNNRLVTFPSSARDRKGIGVDFYFAEGIFDRRTKTNFVEAEAVVDRVYQNIQEYPKRSLGVVAFSSSQQGLIERLLLKRRTEDPSLEWFFQADRPEPFFVKNLETVQGDERDTIIFSVAYAKDSQGRFLHNFGPLNREGGERRLNVAVTRAKDNVQLIASIHDADIDLTRTNSEGARLLRAYLSYAERGEQALDGAAKAPDEAGGLSSFEEEVAEVLREGGFQVDAQVGCSEQRVVIGLRKPGEDRYLLAVENDGEVYHRAKNARDRDSLRQRVLENMGWQFCRVWSTEWYRNREVEKERLLLTAKTAVERSARPEEDPQANAVSEEALPDIMDQPPLTNAFAGEDLPESSADISMGSPLEDTISGGSDADPSAGKFPEGSSEDTSGGGPLADTFSGDSAADALAGASVKDAAADAPLTDIPEEIPLTDPGQEENDFAEEARARFCVEETETDAAFPVYRQLDAMAIFSKRTFGRAISAITAAEAPLSEEFLLKRIVRAFGREKVTKVVISEFDTRMAGCEKRGILRRDGFLYLRDMKEIRLRVPGDKREVKYIALEELADGLLTLIRQNVTATRDGIYKTLASLLGFTRTSESMTARFEEALRRLKEAGSVKEEDGILWTEEN